MKMHVLAFAPYESMRTVMQEIKSKYSDVSMDIFLGTYDDYLKRITEINLYQYDCIMARGYTAKMLKNNSIIPVSEIKVSLYDMLRVITMAKRRGATFAILASSNILEIAHQVMDILQYQDILTYEIESEEEADARMAYLLESGVRLVVGDVYAINAAQRANMPAILITSSKASIEETLQDAINNRKQHLRMYEMLNLFSEVIKNCTTSILVYNSEKKIVLSSFADMTIPFKKLEKIVFKALDNLCEQVTPFTSTHKLDKMILTIRGRILKLEGTYYVFYITISQLPFSFGSKKSIDIIYPSEEYIHEILSKAYYLPKALLSSEQTIICNKSPTVIVGEEGTCKELLAKYLWCTSRYKTMPLVKVDCSVTTENELEKLFDNTNSVLYSVDVPLLISNLHLLSADCQRLLYDFLEDTSFSRQNPLIVTTVENPNALASENKLFFEFCDYLVGKQIHIPSLNQRTEEIPDIIDRLIDKYNLELGKEVIALNVDALEMLCHFQWRYNINQLKSVIRQLVTSSTQHYITYDQVAKTLSSFELSPIPSDTVDLNGSWDKIEQRILTLILRQEHMNYSSAAKRLGLSRSTLYRKLKDTSSCQEEG